MTRYTELRHAGYYQDNLTDKQRQAIADEVDCATSPRTTAPRGSTTSTTINLDGRKVAAAVTRQRSTKASTKSK